MENYIGKGITADKTYQIILNINHAREVRVLKKKLRSELLSKIKCHIIDYIKLWHIIFNIKN